MERAAKRVRADRRSIIQGLLISASVAKDDNAPRDVVLFNAIKLDANSDTALL